MFAAAAVRDGVAYVGTSAGVFYAIHVEDGSFLWNFVAGRPIYGEALATDSNVLFVCDNGYLFNLDRKSGREPATGKTLWRMTFWGSAIESSPVDVGDGLFVIGASDLRRVSLIDSKDGRVVWRTDVYGVAWAMPAIDSERVFASAWGIRPYNMRHVGGFSALDRKSGKLLWRWPAPEGEYAVDWGFAAGPVVADRLVLAGALDGNLYAFPAE